MAEIKTHRPVLLMAGIFAKNVSSIDWACGELQREFGPVQIRSNDQPFDQTRFYQPEMGDNLVKRFIAFRELIDPSLLPSVKLATNAFENQLATLDNPSVQRPVNIDPGYVTEAKLVLATTKDRDHRIFLGQNIYGEITLFYQNHQWNSSRWTYPDYQTEGAIQFLDDCRTYLRELYLERNKDGGQRSNKT